MNCAQGKCSTTIGKASVCTRCEECWLDVRIAGILCIDSACVLDVRVADILSPPPREREEGGAVNYAQGKCLNHHRNS